MVSEERKEAKGKVNVAVRRETCKVVFSATGTHCARLRSQWEDAEGKHKANQLTETFPVLVLSDEKKPKG